MTVTEDRIPAKPSADVTGLTSPDPRSADDEQLRKLLVEIGDNPRGWQGPAGHRVGEFILAEAERIGRRWSRAGGSISGVAAGGAWEEIMRDRDRLCSDENASVIAAIRSALGRAYAAEVGSVQTGMGDPVRSRSTVRRTVKALKSAGRLGIVELNPERDQPTARVTDKTPVWAMSLAAILLRTGWRWPAPPGSCLIAVDTEVAQTHRREAAGKSLLSAGVPAATWSALALLVAGSGPGCALESRWPGAKAIFSVGGARALRESSEIARIATAAVEGRSVRSGRTTVRAAVVGASP